MVVYYDEKQKRWRIDWQDPPKTAHPPKEANR